MNLQHRSALSYVICAISFLVMYFLYTKEQGVSIYLHEILLAVLVFISLSIPYVLLVGGCIWIVRRGPYIASIQYAMFYSSVLGVFNYSLLIILRLVYRSA
jgi:hypothetical protein